jgi:hypothetical protein
MIAASAACSVAVSGIAASSAAASSPRRNGKLGVDLHRNKAIPDNVADRHQRSE